MCVCILGIQSVNYHPWVNVALTSDKVSRIGIESGTYLIFFEVGIRNLVCECIMVCLFLLLYVPCQQLWSLRDGQFT